MERPDKVVLCSASKYEQKFYFNPMFDNLPSKIKDELKIACVVFTEEIGGIIVLYYDEEGNLIIGTEYEDNDYMYDEIGSGLKVNQLRNVKRELFEQLEEYYELFFGIDE